MSNVAWGGVMGLLRAGVFIPVFLGDTRGGLGLGWVAPTVLTESHRSWEAVRQMLMEFSGKCAVGDNTDP